MALLDALNVDADDDEDVNLKWLKNLKRQIDSLPDCNALAELIKKLQQLFQELIEQVIDEIAKLIGLILPPLDLKKIIKYLKNLVLRYLGPYIRAIKKMIKLISAFADVIKAIIAKKEALRCSPTAMVKSAFKQVIGQDWKSFAVKKLFQYNEDLCTAGQIYDVYTKFKGGQYGDKFKILSDALGVGNEVNNILSTAPKAVALAGEVKQFLGKDPALKTQYVEVPQVPPVPNFSTPQGAFLDGEPPTITEISQVLGPETGGQELVITGANFQEGAHVLLGDAECTNVIVNSTEEIVCYTPSGSRGMPVDLQVINPDGQSYSLPSVYSFMPAASPGPAPQYESIFNISRSGGAFGSRNGGEVVRITGLNFQPGLTVQLGTLYTVVNVIDSTQLQITTEYQPRQGPVNIIITNPDGQSVTASQVWSYE